MAVKLKNWKNALFASEENKWIFIEQVRQYFSCRDDWICSAPPGQNPRVARAALAFGVLAQIGHHGQFEEPAGSLRERAASPLSSVPSISSSLPK